MIDDKQQILNYIGELLDVVNDLREKCPWDNKQTFESLRTLTIEEMYELSESILNQDINDIKKEIGDLLLHLILYSRIASEKEWFSFGDVCKSLIDKLKYRHPHIYGTIEVSGSEEVEKNWEKLKLKEKDREHSVLSGVPSSLPSTVKAMRIQQKARSAGFDWDIREQVWDKVTEELNELKEELSNDKQQIQERIEEEFGDFLFSIINAGRLYGIDPDTALENTNKKFISRFNFMENKVKSENKKLHELTLEEMESIWNQAKGNFGE